MTDSTFLRIPPSEWVAHNAVAFAVRDKYPVTPGHTLVIPKRVVTSWFDASREEQEAIMRLVAEVKANLDVEHAPDGYNIGFNVGEAAGQTVMHLHVHVIPRHHGDMDDPRGGVRHVIPSKGNYLLALGERGPLAGGGTSDPFWRHVQALFGVADEIAIVAAFVFEGGVDLITQDLKTALGRGARIRVLTGDYRNASEPAALEALLDFQSSSRGGLDDEGALQLIQPGGRARQEGTLETRVVEVESLPGPGASFHPKSWRFESKRFGLAFVGSSNLSRTALSTGIEWNLRVNRDRDADAYNRIRDEFDAVWASARPLDADWLRAYSRRPRPSRTAPDAAEPADGPPPLESPHRVQLAALAALRASRAQGRQRALVVLATGLGKTWLAVFDYAALAIELGRRPRLLYLAHRRELLRQAAHTYRRLLHARNDPATVGWFVESENDLNADLVFASIAKLSRPEHLARLGTQHFDYVVVDEVHHAAAASYRRVLDVLSPGFLLGLTATPDRADAADVLGLFDDHLAFRADVGAGIELGRLVPFHYYGVKDDIDYDNLPWRNHRFDPATLAAAAQTEQRMQTLWRAWNEHPGERSLVFCCSVSHALYAKAWLLARGVRAKAVFADEGSDDREGALEELAAGQLDALCAVDLLNEGIDLPALDRVVMLRPTESAIVFLQQLGRGLRASPGKSSLTIIDFVGNHRVFLERLRKLLSLTREDSTRELTRLLESVGTLDLPAGCSVDVELEAKQLLSRLFRVGGADEVERVYRELKHERDLRPTAGELLRMDYNPRTLRARHRSWLEFVRSEGDLDERASAALDTSQPWFLELETTSMTKSFKMVTLEVLLEHDTLLAGMPLRELALGAHAYLLRSPELWKDVNDTDRFRTLNVTNEAAWISYWKDNPVSAWVSSANERRAWFRRDDDRIFLNLTVEPALVPAWLALTRELVDYRLAQYRRREASGATSDGFTCSVISNQRDPILKLPSGRGHSPPREVDVRLPDGSIWQFRLAKEFINVARRPGEPVNRLPDLLRRWFGPSAGRPGTTFRVRFYLSPDGLWVEPVRSTVSEVIPLRGIVTYPDLRAAAGHAQDATDSDDSGTVLLPGVGEDPELFAVRVVGSSMDGGRQPTRDGDWAVLRWARGAGQESVLNRVVLVQIEAETLGSQHQLKRLTQRGGKWLLTSDNPDGPTIEPHEGVQVIARLERTVRPEELAPASGTVVAAEQLAGTFQLDELTPSSGRYGGHLFIFIDRAEMLHSPDSIRYAAEQRKPSEAAYVLAKDKEAYCYLGVGRWDESTNLWRIPEVNHGTWRAWGAGKEVSRRLAEGLLARAEAVAQSACARGEGERVVVQGDGRSARIVGRAAQGGVRVAGVDGSFAERTVSLLDLAWVLAAEDDVKANGGLLDEQRINRVRYLEGTPKGATRWVDTGWAIAIVRSLRGQ